VAAVVAMCAGARNGDLNYCESRYLGTIFVFFSDWTGFAGYGS